MLGHTCLYLLGFSKQHAHSIKSQSIFLRKAQNMPHSSSLLHKIWSMVPITLKRALNLVNIGRKNSESSLQRYITIKLDNYIIHDYVCICNKISRDDVMI